MSSGHAGAPPLNRRVRPPQQNCPQDAIKRRFNCVLRRSLADQPPDHPVPKDKDIGGIKDMDSKMIFSTMFHLVLAKESWPLYSHHET